MAEQLFIRILNMSLTGSFVILAVLAVRILLRKAPRIFSYCLWAVVLFRLLCPVSFSAVFSPFSALSSPSVEQGRIEYISEDILSLHQSTAHTISVTPSDTTASFSETAPTADTIGPSSADVAITAGSIIWFLGIFLIALYSIIMLLHLKQKLKNATWEQDNIYLTGEISTPFVMGFLKPRIYLPLALEKEEKRYVLLHEQIHIKRQDHIIKILAFIALCIHWFNPFVWVAFFLSGKDMEMSCDETVIRKLGNGMKKEYSASLLNMATGKRIINGVPLAFGEGDTSGRIHNVLHYKKPTVIAVCMAAGLCTIAAVILLANPNTQSKAKTPNPQAVYYGVVSDVSMEGTSSQRLLVIPGIGEMEIPKAESISTYFEREEQELLLGDLVEITFPEGKEVLILETWPGRFSTSAESIIVKWGGFSLQRTKEDSYQLTFPSGAFPELSGAKAGDMLSFYHEEPEEPAFATSPPESENSRLIATAPILAAGANEYGGPILTVELSSVQIQEIFSGFGLYIRFHLKPVNETYSFSVRSIARSARVIDSYVSDYGTPYDQKGELAFAEDCVFKVNYSMSGIDYKEVSFDDFADFINNEDFNNPCLLTFKDGLVTEAKLQTAYLKYGITYSTFSPMNYVYNYLLENEGEAALGKYYSLAGSETLDIADCAGSELIEVYTGNLGDGDSGIVMFKDAQGNLLCTQDAHTARVGWNNIYLGENEGTPFIMNIYIEDRWDFGVYAYWVYRLDENGGIKQIAGSEFDFALPESEYNFTYDDALFKEWTDSMTAWLENSHLILSTQEGEVRTEKISEADKYNYDTLNLKDRVL